MKIPYKTVNNEIVDLAALHHIRVRALGFRRAEIVGTRFSFGGDHTQIILKAIEVPEGANAYEVALNEIDQMLLKIESVRS